MVSGLQKSMANPRGVSFPFFLAFVLLTSATLAASLSFKQYRTLFSLAHSLTTRVANLRASRGDVAGEARARSIAQMLDRNLGIGIWGVMWNMGWDYLRSYSWRDLASLEIGGVVSDVNKLLKDLSELTRFDSELERTEWIRKNYENVLPVFKSLFSRLLKVFSNSGTLKKSMETIRREVERDFLRDCLEIASNDLKCLLQILRDLAIQFSSSPPTHADDL